MFSLAFTLPIPLAPPLSPPLSLPQRPLLHTLSFRRSRLQASHNNNNNNNNNNNSPPPSTPPDYSTNFSPDTSPHFTEVRVLSIGPTLQQGSLLTLRPISGPCTQSAFKMSVTVSQADSIRAALRKSKSDRRFKNCASDMRPGTHDLLKSVMEELGGFVTKAAITHIEEDVFIARVWIRGRGDFGEIHVDSRPSDAIALALRSCAPIYLQHGLLKAWHVSVESIKKDGRDGLCECVWEYPEAVKSATSLVEESKKRREHLTLAKLKMELDLAVRLQRFGEAIQLRERIDGLCPIERLNELLRKAIEEERYLDASDLQDRITVWKARVRMWEQGNIDLEHFEEETADDI